MMKSAFRKFVREVQFLPPLRKLFFPRFQYMMSAPQLCFLCQCIEKTRNVPGAIIEVGCAAGSTTIFLNKYMDAQKIEKDYFCIDTFSGFVSEDIEYEVINRGKKAELYTAFRLNKKEWFDGTMEMNGIGRVKSIQADANVFDYSTFGPIALCLLDVDLYRPIKHSLPDLFQSLSPGGVIIVDDCDASNLRWDGADQAYKEYIEAINYPENIVFGKLGIIEKTV